MNKGTTVKSSADWTREFARPQVRAALAKVIDDNTPGLVDRLGADPAAFAELITVTHLVVEEADELLREAVISARHSGLNWEQIGEVLGLSRQAAQQRFSAVAAPEPDAVDTVATALTVAPSGSAIVPMQANPTGLPPVGTQVTIDLDYTGGSDEIKMLNRAGQYGWHGVAFTASTWTLEFGGRQWQHLSSLSKEPYGEGWQRIGRFMWSVWWARPTDLPILPGNPDPHAFKSERKLKKELARQSGNQDQVTLEPENVLENVLGWWR